MICYELHRYDDCLAVIWLTRASNYPERLDKLSKREANTRKALLKKAKQTVQKRYGQAGCTVAMYCSEDCLSEAYRQYHRYECLLIRDLWSIYSRITTVIAVHIVATAIVTSFDHDLEAMKEYLDSLDESRQSTRSL
uniref:MYND-type domain-containing protein n=1 Tax=Anopheles farauti TaxID=69004 RepID=A0A182QDK7_9DIPT